MTIDRVNYLNIGFMILSCVIAFILPFQLFLFSYAVLGPLHYLTEISWLHKRDYFTPRKRDYLLLAAVALIIMFPVLFKAGYHFVAAKDAAGKIIYPGNTLLFLRHITLLGQVMIFVSFAAAAVIVLVKNTYRRLIAAVIIIALALLFRSERIMYIVFVIFLPTLIHVFVFTGIFILNGALKSKTLSGMLSFIVFLACGVSLFVICRHPASSSNSIVSNYSAGFYNLNKQIFATFLHRNASHNDIFYSDTGILITRFIAYAYTYHYLNWFSKTSVIRWHEVSRRSLVFILIIWILAVALYFTNYRTGFIALYFLSLLHVIFEFPLNIRSFKDLGYFLISRIKSKQ